MVRGMDRGMYREMERARQKERQSTRAHAHTRAIEYSGGRNEACNARRGGMSRVGVKKGEGRDIKG